MKLQKIEVYYIEYNIISCITLSFTQVVVFIADKLYNKVVALYLKYSLNLRQRKKTVIAVTVRRVIPQSLCLI